LRGGFRKECHGDSSAKAPRAVTAAAGSVQCGPARAKIAQIENEISMLSSARELLTRQNPISMVRAVYGGKQPNPLHFHGRRMSNDAREGKDPDRQTSEEAALSARLQHLGKQLDQQRPSTPAENARAGQSADDRSGMARGLRLSTELVAGVVVGGALGWGIDWLLGISPWAFIVFLLLGFVAGILNVMRSAGMVAERKWREK
jgi:ATP synthase protein I